MGRYYTLRRFFAKQLASTYRKFKPGDDISEYRKTPSDIDQEAWAFGLTAGKDDHDVVVFEGQEWPSRTAFAKRIVDNTGCYSVLSGASHAEFWLLLSGYRDGRASPLGVSNEQNEHDFETYVFITKACLRALLIPFDQAYRLFGREFLANDIARIQQSAKSRVGEI